MQHAFNAFASLALLLSLAHLVHASVYVTNPVQATVCNGGQSCQVQWVDNGESPLLNNIGECDVGLYSGELELVQSLPSVNVATTNSFTFTPNPAAGPNGQYYIVFSASSINYMGFSGSFTLNGMTGTAPGSGAGGSSTPGSTPAGSSTPVGSTPGSASPTPTATSPSSPAGTSTPVGTTTPTESTPTPTAGTPTVSSNPTPTSPITPILTTSGSSTFSVSPSTTHSPTPTNAAVRMGSSASLGSALFVALAGALIF